MKIIIIGIVTVGVILSLVASTLSYQQNYNQNCIDYDGKVTGFLQCIRFTEDFILHNSTIVDLEIGQVFHYRDLELEFYDIEDSRCPLDVTCVWEGKVTTMIHVRNQTHKIAGFFIPDHTVSYISPYNVTLIDIQPHPVSIEKPDYVATLKITKLDD